MMERIVMYIRNLMLGEEDGQALGEYALILGFIAIACIAALTLLGIAIGSPYGLISDGLGAGGGGSSS